MSGGLRPTFGPYELERELARGGMGVVYAARHAETGVAYALKTIQASAGGLDVEELERFRREGELLSRLDHPGIVRVHSAGVQDGVAYLVQALLPGGSLQARLRERGRLGWEEAVALVAELADAVAYAHTAGALHRDIKPDNVLFDEHDRPVLVDFGLGRDLGAESRRMTETGQAMGTPGYMAPEQVEGTRRDDARTDVYGLGALLFALIAGRPPFAGQGLAILAQIVHDAPPDLAALEPDTPRHVAATVASCLAKRLEDRVPSAADLARALRTGAAPTRPARSRLPWVLVMALGLIGLIGLTGGILLRPPPAPVPPAASPPPSLPELRTPAPQTTDARGAVAWGRAVHLCDTDLSAAWAEISKAHDQPSPTVATALLARAEAAARTLSSEAVSSKIGSSVLTKRQRHDWLACFRIYGRLRTGAPPEAMLNGLTRVLKALALHRKPSTEEDEYVSDLVQVFDGVNVPGFPSAVLDFVHQLNHPSRMAWVDRCMGLAEHVPKSDLREWAEVQIKVIRLLDGLDPPAPRREEAAKGRARFVLKRAGRLLIDQDVAPLLGTQQRDGVRRAFASTCVRLGDYQRALDNARIGLEQQDWRAQGVMAIALYGLDRKDEALQAAHDYLARSRSSVGQGLNTIVLGILWDLDTPANVAAEVRRLVREKPDFYGWRLREVQLTLTLDGPEAAQESLKTLQGWCRSAKDVPGKVKDVPAEAIQTILGLPDVRKRPQPLRVLVTHLDAKRRKNRVGLP